MNEINKSALVSTIAAELFHYNLSPRVSMITAVAFVGAVDYMDDIEDFMEAFVDGLNITSLEVVDAEAGEEEMDAEAIMSALADAKYLDEDGLGIRFTELCLLRKEAYKPTTGEIERRFNYSPVKHSPLFVEAVHALEDTAYTTSDTMLSIALKVQAKCGGEAEDQEGYVVRGCQAMDSSLSYFSEFKGDRRGRIYQAACHGPNGQASDRSRALMDLVGVPIDYDIKSVSKLILAEIADMCDDVKASAAELKELGEVDFIVKHHEGDLGVSKPWSFVKAVLIMRELQAGNRPYIGMAVGLDAKCSGPQLGALLVGDQTIAAACGMTLQEVEDAYALAIKEAAKSGFVGITRSGIKKAYMGVFYGQGWEAYTVITGKHAICAELVESLYGASGFVSDDIAKAFHKSLVTSFGAKMVGVRNLFKSYSGKTSGRTKHQMPDGFEVAMNYKVKVNVLGEVMEYDTAKYDILLRNNEMTYKFINFQLKTMDTNEGDFARNGFVNMIQATDALIARMIIVNLKRLGAKHIISVHDCFRVNVTEMHLLEEAIKMAYQDLFGGDYNNATSDLPKGLDILGLYFTGANKQLLEGEEEAMVSQFFDSGKRRMRKVNGVSLCNLISELGTSYYFAK